MKKLMIVLAAVAMAAVAQAAQVNWTCTKIYQPNTTTTATGYIGYFFQDTGSKDVDAIVAAIKDKTFDTTYGASAMASATSSSGTLAKTGLGAYEAGTYNFYTILFDASSSGAAKNYIITDNVAVTFKSATGAMPAVFATITGSAGQNWQSVPEPTSAMLLLLGVAGLALKRKQK